MPLDWQGKQKWIIDYGRQLRRKFAAHSFGFDFKAVEDKNSNWVTTYNDINDALHDIKFAIFPSLDKEYLWLFPKRQRLHKRLDEFLRMIDGVIENKRRVLKEQKESDVEENERDLLTLMIESELKGEGALTDEELKVYREYEYYVCF